MQDTDRFKLLFGPYETPLFEYGDIVWCDPQLSCNRDGEWNTDLGKGFNLGSPAAL